VKVNGTCPSCGRVVDAGQARARSAGVTEPVEPVEPDDEALPKIPWHLWLLAGAVALYLGYRAMQGFEWLFG
jgi:hypothetical protein